MTSKLETGDTTVCQSPEYVQSFKKYIIKIADRKGCIIMSPVQYHVALEALFVCVVVSMAGSRPRRCRYAFEYVSL